MGKAGLYGGTFPRRSRLVKQAAYANPATRCRRCGRTYAEALAKWGKQGAKWQAGHVVDGHPGSPLAPEHAFCNQGAGGRLAKARRHARDEPKSPNS